jgi:hypothetical protein
MASIGSFTIENAAPTPAQKRRMDLISKSRYAARWFNQKERNNGEEQSDSDILDLEE